jgi:hypothetical protein
MIIRYGYYISKINKMMKNILVISLPLEVSKATVSRPLSLCGDDDNLL